MKRKYLVLTLLVLLVACLFALLACETEHIHKYSSSYNYDEQNHWRTCSCGEKYVKSHTFSEQVVTEATETSEGLLRISCVCGYSKDEVIPKLSHMHKFVYTIVDDDYHYAVCESCSYEIKAEHSFGSWQTVTPATTSSQGVKQASCACGATKSGLIPLIIENSQVVDLYAINDFHGKVERIAQIGSYLKGRKRENSNTVLLNSGDMFQGSLASNYNYGNLLTDCMDNIGFDSFTYGNHEFDWGLDAMRELSAKSTTPFLGANIYNWNAQTREWGDFASDLAREYTTVMLPSGVKVGIIGVIGKDQITSISSNLVQTIGFKDPKEIIPPLAEKLRDEEGCHVVIVSIHSGQTALVGSDVEQYVDGVFCAHTHQTEYTLSNGVPYVQGGSYGSHISYINLTIKNGVVSAVGSSDYGIISYKSSWQSDTAVAAIVAEYAKETDALAAEKLCTVNGTLNKYNTMPTLVCRAIAEYAMDCGYDVDVAICNQARNNIYAGTITYEKLYEALPFDNLVYMVEIKGSDIIKTGGSNYIWRINGNAFEANKLYKVAVIDYVLFHQNSNREYNYLASAFKDGRQPVALAKDGMKFYNYREITRAFLEKMGNVDVADYNITGNRGNRNLLNSSVSFNDGYYTSSAQAVWALLPQELIADKYRFAA